MLGFKIVHQSENRAQQDLLLYVQEVLTSYYIVIYYISWVKTSWTDSMFRNNCTYLITEQIVWHEVKMNTDPLYQFLSASSISQLGKYFARLKFRKVFLKFFSFKSLKKLLILLPLFSEIKSYRVYVTYVEFWHQILTFFALKSD